jgi:hypothetical protein
MTLREDFAPRAAHDAGIHQALGIDFCLEAPKVGVLRRVVKIVQSKASIQCGCRLGPFGWQCWCWMAWIELYSVPIQSRGSILLISGGSNSFIQVIKMLFMKQTVKVLMIHDNPKENRTVTSKSETE